MVSARLDYATARGCSVGVIVFAVPIGVCVSRVRERKNHPTLAGGEESVKVVHIMAENFVFPTREEGFSFCRVVKTEDDVEHVLNQLLETREK